MVLLDKRIGRNLSASLRNPFYDDVEGIYPIVHLPALPTSVILSVTSSVAHYLHRP